MRYKRLIAALLTAVFLLGSRVPVNADDGRNRIIFDMTVKDHPWQDDTVTGGTKPVKRPLGFVIGPLTFTLNIAIPNVQKPSQDPLTPTNNKTTQKNVEKRK